MKDVSRNLSWVFVGVTGLIVLVMLLMSAVPAAEGPKEMHLSKFGRLPVLDGGRVKPIDTLARVSLMVISGRQEYTDAEGQAQPAVRWLLDAMTTRTPPGRDEVVAGPSAKTKAYRIEDAEVREKLGLANRSGALVSLADLTAGGGAEAVRALQEMGEKIVQSRGKTGPENAALGDLALQVYWHALLAGLETPHKVFRIENDQVRDMLGLEARSGLRYSLGELAPRASHLLRELDRARSLGRANRTVFDEKVIEVGEHLELYMGLVRGETASLHLIPPSTRGGEWLTYSEAMFGLRQERGGQPVAEDLSNARAFLAILSAYSSKDTEGFNKAVDAYGAQLTKLHPADMERVGSEASFNDFAPFYRCMLLYVFVFLIACVSWMWRDPVITWYAFGLLAFTVLLHTWALAMRMYLQGRPPVTNLYSSAVFIGWACVLISLAIELKFQNALATAVASMTGFATLIIAHYLSGSGDTLEMMQAVLDTNFWLATHVTSVTIGYSATFVAGVFGLLFLWMMMVTHCLSSLREGGPISAWQVILFGICALASGVFAITFAVGIVYGLWYGGGANATAKVLVQALSGLLALALAYPAYLIIHRVKQSTGAAPAGVPRHALFLERLALTADTRRVLLWMIYGTVCFAMLFSFVGTVLGGIWADYSWGRFWGWDPKENGALLIVIMNALILHARWAGLARDRGIAILTLVGSMVTMWSWFGTNQLGIGLHAYGFNNALVLLCKWFWISHLALIGLALLPLRNWRDYQPTPTVEAALPPKAQSAPRTKGRRGSTRVQPA